MEKGVTPLCGLLGEWRMENGEWRMTITNEVLMRSGDHHRKSSMLPLQWWKKRPRVRNRRPAVKPSPRILHSSPTEEKKLGFSFSENGPSAIQGEGATSPFSDLREWEERGVTTPISCPIALRDNVSYVYVIFLAWRWTKIGREEVYGRWNELPAFREATSFFHIVVFTSGW
jgi:hypothetical protein